MVGIANNLIQIKRSTSNSSVPTLSAGELAFTQASNTFYVGAPDGMSGNIRIGGEMKPGTLTANQALVANSTSGIDKIITANLTAKEIWANGSAGTAGYILFSGGAGGNVYWVPTGAVSINVDSQYTWTNTQSFQNTITFNSTINGTANNALNLNSKSEGNLNVNNAVTANDSSYLGGVAAASYVNTSGSYTLTGNIDFESSNTFFGTNIYANAQLIILPDGDIVLSNGSGIQANGTWGSAGEALLNDGSGNNYWGAPYNANNASYLNNKSEGNLNVNSALTSNSTTYINGNTAGDLNNYAANAASNAYSNAMSDTLSRSGSYTGNNIFGGTNTVFNSNVVFSGANVDMASTFLRVHDVGVTGNLTVSGTLTTIDTQNLVIEDPLIKLANGNAADIQDIGFYGLYVDGVTNNYTGFFRQAGSPDNNPLFKIFSSTVQPTTTVTATNQGTLQAYLQIGSGSGFVANASNVQITANSTFGVNFVANSLTLSTALAATSGGTGQNSYSTGDLLYASGSTTLSKLSIPGSAANGQVLQIQNNLPAYGTLDGGTF
jgi:hypothetical protein